MRDLSVVNPQILHAVRAANTMVLEKAKQVGSAVVDQQVIQSTGLAVQDSVDHLQNALALDSAVSGKALANILAGENVANSLIALVVSQLTVETGILYFREIGSVAGAVASQFPPGS